MAFTSVQKFTDIDVRDLSGRNLDVTSINIGSGLTGSGVLRWTGSTVISITGSMQGGYISIASSNYSGSATFGSAFPSGTDIKVILTPSGSNPGAVNTWWMSGSSAQLITTTGFCATIAAPLAVTATFGYIALAI